jgi:hypothetical protein
MHNVVLTRLKSIAGETPVGVQQMVKCWALLISTILKGLGGYDPEHNLNILQF